MRGVNLIVLYSKIFSLIFYGQVAGAIPNYKLELGPPPILISHLPILINTQDQAWASSDSGNYQALAFHLHLVPALRQ